MATFGIVPEGFNVKTEDVILSDVQKKQLAGISPSLDVQPTSLMGNINGPFAAAVAEGWLVLAALYNGMDPDQATGDQLASVSLITGTKKLGASPTQVLKCVVNVGAGFNAAVGAMFASIVGNPLAVFKNKAPVSNPGGVAANEVVDFEAVNDGPQQCLTGTLTQIAQGLTGWNSITNPTDGIPGQNDESDADLRLRRQQELSVAGATTPDAIRADVLEQMVEPTTTTNTTSCVVLYNDTDAVDANGLPPHSVEVIARQPGNTADDDLVLATLILSNTAAGIGTHGLNSKVVIDGQGNHETVYYTRPVDVDFYIDITVRIVPSQYPADGDTQVKNALLAYAIGAFGPGAEVFVRALSGAVFVNPLDLDAGGVKGVTDVEVFKLDTAFPPVNTANWPIDVRHTAALDSSRIRVTTVTT